MQSRGSLWSAWRDSGRQLARFARVDVSLLGKPAHAVCEALIGVAGDDSELVACARVVAAGRLADAVDRFVESPHEAGEKVWHRPVPDRPTGRPSETVDQLREGHVGSAGHVAARAAALFDQLGVQLGHVSDIDDRHAAVRDQGKTTPEYLDGEAVALA
jgi:hypothetical protein